MVELVEGKGYPCQAVVIEFEGIDRRTVVLLLRMTKSYFSTGRYVILIMVSVY